MDKPASLHYGSLGVIAYSPTDRRWNAEKHPLRTSASRWTLLTAPAEREETSPPGDDDWHDHSADYLAYLARSIPELVPALPVTRELQKIPENQSPASSGALQYRTCGLLARGCTKRARDAARGTIDYIIFATGAHGNRLELRPTGLVTRGWRRPTDLQPEACVTLAEPLVESSICWTCPDGQIFQVRASAPREDLDPLVAVRSCAALYIFQPCPKQRARKTHDSATDARAMRLCHNLLIRIPLSSLSEVALTDVNFNPWYHNMFLVADAAGQSLACELMHKGWPRKATGAQLLRRLHGSPTLAVAPHMVLWLTVNNFALCKPSAITVFDVRTMTTATASLDLEKALFGSLVDAKVCPFAMQFIFVLTASHVLTVEWHSTDAGASLRILQACAHYHKAAEQSMRLAFRGTSASPFAALILYSTASAVMVEYSLYRLGAHSRPFSLSNPAHLMGVFAKAPSSGVLDLHFVPLQIEAQQHEDSGLTLPDDMELYQALCLCSQLDVSSSLILEDPTRVPALVEGPNWMQISAVRRTRQGPVPIGTRQEVDAEPSASDQSDTEEHLDWYEPEHKDDTPTSGSLLPSFKRLTRNVSREKLYSTIAAQGPLIPSQPQLATIVRALCCNILDESPKCRYAPELAQLIVRALTPAHIEDIDGATEVASLLSISPQGGTSNPLYAVSIGQLHQGHLCWRTVDAESGQLPIKTIYDHLVTQYVSPLASTIATRTRLRVDGLIRSASAALWLGSHRIMRHTLRTLSISQLRPSPEASAPASDLSSQDPHPYYSSQASTDSIQHSQPGTYSLPFRSTDVDRDPKEPLLSTMIDPTRELSAFTDFSAMDKLSDNIWPILSDWQAESDPNDYKFSEDVVLQAESQPPANKKGQRRLARQRESLPQRQAASKSSQVQTSSQVAHSQPEGGHVLAGASATQVTNITPANAAGDNSSQAVTSKQAASQPLPGKFGSRSVGGSTLLRGKRKAGF